MSTSLAVNEGKRMSGIFKAAAMLLLAIGTTVARAGTVTYVYTDSQGTPLAEADASGAITATFDYKPYGTPVASMSGAPNGPGYTGHVNDADAGIVYMQARYYDSNAGRFLSVDPKNPAEGNVFDLSRYTYVNDNPITNIDPDGTTCRKLDSGSYRCELDGNRGNFSKDDVRAANKDYTNAVNKLASHPNVTVKVTVNGVSFFAKAGLVAKGLASARVDTAPASKSARAATQGGGLFATSNYFLNYTPLITIYRNAVTADRNGKSDNIQRDLERTFAHEGIHTLPVERALHEVYMQNAKQWDDVHHSAYDEAGNKLLDGGR